MSEPITLTGRELAVFGSMIEYVRKRCINWVHPQGTQPSGNAIARWMEDWLIARTRESASPPRVPVSSAHPDQLGVESGPGQPIDILLSAAIRVAADRRRPHPSQGDAQCVN